MILSIDLVEKKSIMTLSFERVLIWSLEYASIFLHVPSLQTNTWMELSKLV